MNYSIEDILLSLEEIFIASLKPHLKAPLSKEINYQLENILTKQFAVNNYGELGGSINLKKKGRFRTKINQIKGPRRKRNGFTGVP